MTNIRFRSAAGALVALSILGFLLSCATNQEHATERRSTEELRVLYPHQYLDSLDPWERNDEEGRMMENRSSRQKK